jgi:signal peptidase I
VTERARTKLPFWASTALNLVCAVVALALIQGFIVKIYRVPSGSMQETLQGAAGGGDRILANRMAYLGGAPKSHDVVVFVKPQSWQEEHAVPSGSGFPVWVRGFGDITGLGPSNEQFMVKRVIAVGGQTVSCCGTDGKILVDGTPLEEPYVSQDFAFDAGTQDCGTSTASPRCFPQFRVPDGQLVVLGDNRSNSSDSVALCRMQPAGTPADCMRTVPESSVIGKVSGIVWPLDRIGAVE